MRVPITSRSVSLDLLNKVTFEDSYANLVMPNLLEEAKLNTRDSALAQELAFSTIRWQLTYDFILGQVSSRPVNEIDAIVLNSLRLGCHQLLKMRIPAHAAINETVNLIRAVVGEKAVGFANGVLRRVSEKSLEQWIDIAEDKALSKNEFLSIQYSHPEWIVRALTQSLTVDGLSDQIEDLLATDNHPALVNLVALPGLSKVSDFESESVRANTFSPFGFSIESGNPGDIPEVRTGLARVQDEGSQIAAMALVAFRDVKENETWLDMCAGPGGKAALLAALANQSSARLIANEVQEHRAKLVESALRPFDGVEVTVTDGRTIGELSPETYDRIIVDAPCSGLGALRRRPEARWRKSAEDLKTLTQLQFELVESASKALKKGGLLLYVTCSPHLSETTAVIDKAQRTLGLKVLDLTTELNSKLMDQTLPSGRKTVQLYTHRDNTDCMFMAMMTKD
jgi:16S rRNA (cytosine967-C5)-methyltransferase